MPASGRLLPSTSGRKRPKAANREVRCPIFTDTLTGDESPQEDLAYNDYFAARGRKSLDQPQYLIRIGRGQTAMTTVRLRTQTPGIGGRRPASVVLKAAQERAIWGLDDVPLGGAARCLRAWPVWS